MNTKNVVIPTKPLLSKAVNIGIDRIKPEPKPMVFNVGENMTPTQKRVADATLKATAARQEADYANSTFGMIANSIKETPRSVKKVGGDIKDFGVSVLQSIPRGVATVGMSAGNLPAQLNNELFQKPRGKQEFELPFKEPVDMSNSVFGKMVFGDKPLKSLQQSIPEAKSYAETKLGLSPTASKFAVPPVVIGSTVLDLTGFGSGAKNAALKKIAESKADDVIEGVLKKTFKLTDDAAIKELTPLLKEADTPAKVTKVIDDYNAAVKATQAIPKAIKPEVPPTETSNFFKEIGSAKETGYLNTKRLGITDEEAKLMRAEYDKSKEGIERLVGKKITNEDVVKLADETQQVFKGVIDEVTQKEIIAAQYNLSKKIADAAKDKSRTADLIDFLTSDKSLSTFSGRLLQARQIAVKEGATLSQRVLDDVIRVTDDIDAIKKAAEGLDLNDPKVATEFYRKFISPKAGEWVDVLRYNSMLSNPVTWISNAASNLGSMLIQPVVKTVAGGIDMARSAVTGAERTRSPLEGAKYIQGVFKKDSFQRAGKAFSDVWKDNIFSNLEMVGRDMPLATTKGGKVVENTLKVAGKIMESVDQFYNQLAQAGELSALNYRKKIGGKIYADSILSESKDKALRTLFRNKAVDEVDGPVLRAIGTVSDLVNMARKSDNKVLRWPAKILVPFVQFATKGVQTGLEFNPATGWATIKGARDPIEQAAKWTIGLGVGAGLFGLSSSGSMTGAPPASQAEKTKWADAGIQPYSFKVGDKWVDYTKLPPQLSYTFAFMQSVGDMYKTGAINEDTAKVMWQTFANSAKFFTDQSFMRSLGDITKAIGSGDENALARLISNVPSQFVPFKGFATWLERLTDEYQRTPNPNKGTWEKQWEYFKLNFPGLAQTVDKRFDAAGNPITISQEERIRNAFSPLKIKEQSKEQANTAGLLGSIREAGIVGSKNKKEQNLAITEYTNTLNDARNSKNKQLYVETIQKLSKEDPVIAEAVLEKMNKQVIPKNVQYIQALGVSNKARATAIDKELKRIKDPQERTQFLRDLQTYKVLNQDIIDQLFVINKK